MIEPSCLEETACMVVTIILVAATSLSLVKVAEGNGVNPIHSPQAENKQPTC